MNETTKPANTKGRILESAFGLFYREGFTRVSVDAIADKANVTKRTVYYHFQSKDDIVAEVLRHQHEFILHQFQDWAGSEDLSAEQKIENLFNQLHDWADGEEWLGSGFTRISTELADRPGHPARKAASFHKALVERWLAGQFEQTGMRRPEHTARQVMLLIEGSMSLALIHGDTKYIQTAGDAAAALLSRDNCSS